MEIKQNPFSFYDFLGYLTPGSIFLYGVIAWYAHANSDLTPYAFIVEKLSFDKAEIYIPFIFIAYTCGHVLSFLSSIIIEKYSVWSDGYPSKYLLDMPPDGYLNVESHKFLRIPIRLIIWLLLLPISFFDLVMGRWCNFRELYTKPVDKFLREIIFKKLAALIEQHAGIKTPPQDTPASRADFFRYAYHYAVENAPNHLPKMQNYVALYGFLRTLTLISVVFFWGIVWHICMGKLLLTFASEWLIFSSFLSYILYMSFVKFYRRFSLEALMALAATFRDETNR